LTTCGTLVITLSEVMLQPMVNLWYTCGLLVLHLWITSHWSSTSTNGYTSDTTSFPLCPLTAVITLVVAGVQQLDKIKRWKTGSVGVRPPGHSTVIHPYPICVQYMAQLVN